MALCKIILRTRCFLLQETTLNWTISINGSCQKLMRNSSRSVGLNNCNTNFCRKSLLNIHGTQKQRYPSLSSCRCASDSKRKKEYFEYKKSRPESFKHVFSVKQRINSSENADFFISHLSKTEKRFLYEALSSTEKTNGLNGENASEESGGVTKRQLRLVFLHNFVPFVGFGFLDNAIMILAGECIDLTIGVTLGISTMAAAALGNTISDIAGIGLAGSVEMLFLRMGLPVAALTPEQAESRSTIISSNMGKAVGIVLGCLIGMFPLLFLEVKDEQANTDQPCNDSAL